LTAVAYLRFLYTHNPAELDGIENLIETIPG